MTIIDRIRELMKERGWSEYKLSKLSDLPPTTIANIFKRNSMPSIPTLEAICRAFGITIVQFFSGVDSELEHEHRRLFEKYAQLNKKQKLAVMNIIEAMLEDE